jgi:TrfA protein
MQPISQLLSDDFAIQTFANSRPENAESTPSIPSSQGLRVRKGKMSGVDFANMKAKEAQARLANPSYEQAVLELILPDWNELYRGVPNGFLRSGLFTARSKSIRNDIRGIKIASLSNFDIFYKGQELRQDDLSVWIALMTRAKKQPIGDKIFFVAYSLVKDLGWSLNSVSYGKVKACIERLKLTSLKIGSKDQKSAYAGSLIRDFAYDAIDEHGNMSWMIRLEPEIAKLFVNENTTFLEWEERKKLGTRSTLAQWLHGYFSSHTMPIPIAVAKIHELCESGQKSLPNFKIRVRQALEHLVTSGCLLRYTITNEVVHVTKAPRRLHGVD